MGASLGKLKIYDNGWHDKALVGAETALLLALLPKFNQAGLQFTILMNIAIPFGMQTWVSLVAGPTMFQHLEKQVRKLCNFIYAKPNLLSIFQISDLF